MKAGWIKTPLGEIAELRGRIGWKGLTAKEYTKSGPRFLSVHSLNYGDYVDFRDAFHISQERYDESPEIMLQEDDILICKDGAGIGKLGVVPEILEPTTINSSLLLIRPSQKVLPKYLYFCLLSPYFQEIVQSRLEGATTPHLYQRDITTFPVFLPPLEEQQRIVAVLDEAFEGLDSARAHAEANLQNALELFPAILTAQFARSGDNWSEKTLEALCEKITDGTHQTPKYFDDGYIFLSSKNVTSGKIDWENIKYVDEAQHRAMQKRLSPRIGDVLLAKNGTTGVAAIVDREVEFDIYVSLALLRSKGEILPEFLLYFTNSSLAKAQFNQRIKGTGVPNLHLKEIRQVKMPYPTDIRIQQELVRVFDRQLDECKATIAACETKLQDLEDLRQSLLQKAFAGELT